MRTAGTNGAVSKLKTRGRCLRWKRVMTIRGKEVTTILPAGKTKITIVSGDRNAYAGQLRQKGSASSSVRKR